MQREKRQPTAAMNAPGQERQPKARLYAAVLHEYPWPPVGSGKPAETHALHVCMQGPMRWAKIECRSYGAGAPLYLSVQIRPWLLARIFARVDCVATERGRQRCAFSFRTNWFLRGVTAHTAETPGGRERFTVLLSRSPVDLTDALRGYAPLPGVRDTYLPVNAAPVHTPPTDAGWLCVGCGAHNAGGAEFCANCGERRPDPGPEVRPEASDWLCTNCGGRNRASAFTCRCCGAPRREPPEPSREWVCLYGCPNAAQFHREDAAGRQRVSIVRYG